MHDRAGRHLKGHVLKNRACTVREIDVLDSCTRKRTQVATVDDILGLRLLVEQVEDARAARKRLLQAAAQVRNRDHRAEGGHERRHARKGLPGIDRALCAKRCGKHHHGHIKPEHQTVRRRHAARRTALQAIFHLRQRIHAGIKLLGPHTRLAELQRFAQTAQAVEHERVHGAEGIAQLPAAISRRTRGSPRRHHADQDIRRKRGNGQLPADAADEGDHDGADQHGDEHRGEGMRVEHLKQLDVRGHERHQIAFAAALELRRGKRAQLAEHSVADKGQDAKRQIVVAHLLAIMQGAAQKAAGDDHRDARAQTKRRLESCDAHDGQSCAHRKEDGAQKADDAQGDRCDHDRHKRFDKLHHTAHDRDIGSALLGGAGIRICSFGSHARRIIGFANVRRTLLGPRRERLELHLLAPQLRVCPTGAAQLLVRTALDHAPVRQHEDAVGFGDGRQAVRDHDDGAAFRQLVDNADDGLLAVRIHVRRCLIEDVDGGIVQKRAGKRQTLALTAGEVAALLGHGSIKPAGCANEPIDTATA